MQPPPWSSWWPASPLPSAMPHRRVLERPPSPSHDRSTYRPMEPSNPDTSPWGRDHLPSTVGGRAPTKLHWSTCLHYRVVRGKEEGEQEGNERCITMVTSPIGALRICRTTRISISPWGRPQGPLVPCTATMPPTSLTPSLAMPPPPPVLPSPEAGPSGSGTPLDLLNPCGNRVLWRLAPFAAPSGKGHVPESWDSTAELSC
jgi:hypothetical protein